MFAPAGVIYREIYLVQGAFFQVRITDSHHQRRGIIAIVNQVFVVRGTLGQFVAEIDVAFYLGIAFYLLVAIESKTLFRFEKAESSPKLCINESTAVFILHQIDAYR